jgi:pimeloyl-ACP methyl ester carboxylesterase
VLHLERGGRPLGPDTETFVLVHGFGASSFTWRRWMPELERRGHVVRVDLLGCGRSPAPHDGPYDPEGQAGLVLDRLRDLAAQDPPPSDPARPEGDGKGVTLVGHSLGGGIALFAALELERARTPPRRLVLVGGAAYPQPMPPFVGLARRRVLAHAALDVLPTTLLVRQVLRSIVFDPAVVTDDLVEGYARPLERPGATHALLETARRIEPPDLPALTARYPGLSTPTLLLWGRHDRVVPAWVGQRLARTLPRARLHLLDRCGHLPQDERPDASVAALAAFLDA